MKKYICITAAVNEEIKGLKGRLKESKKIVCNGFPAFVGMIGDKDVILSTTGMGKDKTRKTVSEILEKFDVSTIISIGFGGGINKELSTSDLVLCEGIKDFNGDDRQVKFFSNSDLLTKAVQYLKKSNTKFYKGVSLTVDKIISTVEEKNKVGTDPDVMVVEMENMAIASVASSHSIPFLMVRSISDTAFDDISFLDRFEGNFSKFKIGLYAATHPDIISKLNNLRKMSEQAASTLSLFVLGFLNS